MNSNAGHAWKAFAVVLVLAAFTAGCSPFAQRNNRQRVRRLTADNGPVDPRPVIRKMVRALIADEVMRK